MMTHDDMNGKDGSSFETDEIDYELEEFVFDTERDDEDDDDGDDDGKSGKGGKGRKKYRIIVEPFLDFADDPSLSPEENAERKLRLLAISPVSVLVPGASSFASENDLARKIFMADVGQRNGEASVSDIANPDFVKERDELQHRRRTLFGIPHPSLVLSSGAALMSSIASALGSFASAVTGKSKPDKSANKSQKSEVKKAKLLDFSAEKETFGFSKDDEYGVGKDYNPDDPDAALKTSATPDFGDNFEHQENTSLNTDHHKAAIVFKSLSSYFSYLSEKAKNPVQSVDLSKKSDGKGGKGGKAGSNAAGPSNPWQDLNPIK
ncbi:MAG: hypothetical protein RBR86_06395 [Pseudobdellovibrionaceae bacterium]|jgi:hypothetical protein|nr:hypothetical protein [Pseudobdellovibrionaceae bacterium]